MALRSIAPSSCTPLLRRLPAKTSITSRTGLPISSGTKNIIFPSSGHLKLNPSLRIHSRGILRRLEDWGAELRLARAQSSLTGQGVVNGEESRGANPKARLLILYSKPGCCLCDGLKEKLEGSEIFSCVELQVRDITTNSEWWNAYQYEIPVLARVREDGTEEPLPRLSPRLSAEQVQKKILALMASIP